MSVREITPKEVKNKLGNGHAPVLLDVRREEEVKEGTIPGSVHVPGGYLASTVKDKIKDKSTPVVVFCARGVRSKSAAALLSHLGYQNVRSMSGGINQWKDEGFDLTKGLHGSDTLPSRPKIVAVDMDGTILDSKNNEKLGKPIPGIKEKLEKYKKQGWAIVIWTVRAKSPEIISHLKKNGIPFDYFNSHPWQPKDSGPKILADVYLDDRAVTFSGNPKDYDSAMSHKPWWSKALGDDDEFRGGDPEEMQAKKEEKREEQEEMQESVGKAEVIPGGLSSGKPDSDFDESSIAEGAKVELEHTSNLMMAREIAKDHLSEDPDYYKKLKKMEKAQAGEEGGEFRGGDPEELQAKREEKREEQAEAGELEDQEDEEEIDPDEIAEMVEEEEEEEAEKSYFAAINSGSGESIPVDTWEDYRPRNINGDPLDLRPPIKPIDLTAEPRPGKNQHKPWSDVTGYKVPLQGDPWVHLRQYSMRGDEKELAKEKARFYRAMNHGLTFDPDFYLAKAIKGEVVPGHKYIYRWMDERGNWAYKYSDGVHQNHGPGNVGNVQGHSLEVPEEHLAKDPKLEDPEGAFHAAKEHALFHGGVFRSNLDSRPMLMKIHGHKGGAPRSRQIDLVDEQEARKHHKVPEGAPLDHEKISWSTLNRPARGGAYAINFDDLDKRIIKMGTTQTEVDAENKPFLQWRFAEKTKERKGRAKRGEGREISVRFIDPDHPLAEELKAGSSKTGWQHSSFNDIDALRRFVAKKKREHAQLLGRIPIDNPIPPTPGKPIINMIESGSLKKKVVERPYRIAGRFDPDKLRWVESDVGESERYRKKRKTLVVDWEDEKHRSEILNALTKPPDNPSESREGEGELYPALLFSAIKLVGEYNAIRTARGQQPIIKEDRDRIIGDLVNEGRMGVLSALDTYDPVHFRKKFSSHALNHIRGNQQGRLRGIKAERTQAAIEGMGSSSLLLLGDKHKTLKDISDAVDQGKLGSIEYEDPDRWFDKAHNHLSNLLIERYENLSDEERETLQENIDAATNNLKQIEDHYRRFQDPEAIVTFVNEWNHPSRGGAGFLPELNQKDEQKLFDNLDLIARGGKSAEDHLQHEFGDERLNESLDELHSLMEGADSQDHPNYGETEHAQVGLHDRDLKRYIQEHGIKTVRDLVSKINETPVTLPGGRPSQRAQDNLSRFQNWLRHDPNLDEDYGVPPARAGEPAPEVSESSEPKGPTEEIVPGVQRRRSEKTEKAIAILRKANEEQQEDPSGLNLQDQQQGQKLFQPIPEGVEVEDNPNYDPDPKSGNSWAKRYQDPETGSTRYVDFHKDRTSNPKLHHNNLMRYLDAQLPKIRKWYKERLASQNLMDRAIGLFLMLMDQAKAKHHDEAEGGLSTLKVGQVTSGDGDVTVLSLGDNYSINVTLDPAASAVLSELMEGKSPEDLVFSVEGQPIDPEMVEKFLNDTFGVSAHSFRTYHGTKQYSKEFQNLIGESTDQNMEQVKEQALDNTASALGHQDGANSIRDHIDPIASEALHMMSHTKVGKPLAKGYALQGKRIFQGFPVSIENKKGSTRSWYDSNADKKGETKMHYDYGYIRGTKGTDGDHVDVYLGPNEDADTVYVIHQRKAPDFVEYDEDKVMLGFGTAREAKDAYIKQYDNPKFFGTMTPLSLEEFREKIGSNKYKGKTIKSQIWNASSTVPDRTGEEELFSQWLHDYPIHQHESRWTLQQKKDQEAEDDLKPVEGHFGGGVEIKTHDIPGDEAGEI